MVIDGIDYFGIDEILPTNIEYFKEELICTVFNNSKNLRNIKSIVSIAVDAEISSVKIINTPVRVSNEGQRLSGKKLLIEIILDFTIKYTSDTKEQYIYIFKEKLNKIFYIVVPLQISGQKVDDLVRKRKISIKSYVEDLYGEIRNDNNLYVRTLLLLNLNFNKL